MNFMWSVFGRKIAPSVWLTYTVQVVLFEPLQDCGSSYDLIAGILYDNRLNICFSLKKIRQRLLFIVQWLYNLGGLLWTLVQPEFVNGWLCYSLSVTKKRLRVWLYIDVVSLNIFFYVVYSFLYLSPSPVNQGWSAN